jgi:hypothetical protein
MLAYIKSLFGVGIDYAVIFLTMIVMVFVGAKLYPRLAT